MKNKEAKSYRTTALLGQKTKFSITEAYRALRTNLLFTLDNKKCNKVLICSALPLDGKTTTAVNLAITMAKSGTKVLLIDCDLRKGRIHSFFDLQKAPGFSDVVSGQASIADSVLPTQYENLFCLCAGTTPPNPAEILASQQTKDILASLENDFDYMILDTAPINIVSDTIPLCQITDGSLFVVRQNETRHTDIAEALDKLAFVEAKVLGFVVNSARENKPYYQKYTSRYRRSYYSYYYYSDKK